MQKKPIIIIAILCVIALGLGYWVGLHKEGPKENAANNTNPTTVPNAKPTAESGTLLWEFETGRDVVSSPAISPDGILYIGSKDKKVYAIRTNSKGLAKSPWPMRGQNPQHTGRAPKKE